MPLPDRLQQALQHHLDDLQMLGDLVQRQRDAMAAGNFVIVDFNGLLTRFARARADIIDLKARPGIGLYTRRIFGNASLDVGARYNAVQAAIETAALTIRNGMPTGAQGFVLAFQLNSDPAALDQIIWRSFTPAQTSSVRADLDTVIAAIDELFDDLAGLI